MSVCEHGYRAGACPDCAYFDGQQESRELVVALTARVTALEADVRWLKGRLKREFD